MNLTRAQINKRYYDKNKSKIPKGSRNAYHLEYMKTKPESYREKMREYYRKYAKKRTLEGKSTISVNKWREKNQYKAKTHQQVHQAVKVGKLVKQPCQECGETKVNAHHPDYSKPLKVLWLCSKHHKQLHFKLNNKI